MFRLALLLAVVLLFSTSVSAVTLTWDYTQCTDFSKCGLATQFNMKTDVGCTGVFSTVATMSANTQTWTDPTSYNQGQLVCYEVNAANQQGESTPSNVVRFQVPFFLPLPPSNLH